MPETEIDLTDLPVSLSLRERALLHHQHAEDFCIVLGLYYTREMGREKLKYLFLRTYNKSDIAIVESGDEETHSKLMPNTSHQVLIGQRKGIPYSPEASEMNFNQEDVDLFTEILQLRHAAS